jgi:NAD(P)-dependent dehydrogenase (short-subunit alcohol dehydrogenase family)
VAPGTFDLGGRVALITAAAAASAGDCAAARAPRRDVAVASRKLEGCETPSPRRSRRGRSASAHACHIGEPAQIAAAVADVETRHGRLDILVNNAATNPYFGPSIDMELAAWQKTVDVHIRGYFWASIEAARRMQRQGKGAIVNVASVNAFRPMDGQACYSLTKAAIVNMTQGSRRSGRATAFA